VRLDDGAVSFYRTVYCASQARETNGKWNRPDKVASCGSTWVVDGARPGTPEEDRPGPRRQRPCCADWPSPVVAIQRRRGVCAAVGFPNSGVSVRGSPSRFSYRQAIPIRKSRCTTESMPPSKTRTEIPR
jgi:hypothetical protein